MTNKSDEISDKASENLKKQAEDHNATTNKGSQTAHTAKKIKTDDDLIHSNSSEKEKALSEEVEKYKKDYLYLLAEFDNYKKNVIKERSDLIKFAGERLAFDLLNVLDIFEKALASDLTSQNLNAFKDGIELTAQELKKTLEKHGIREIPSLGQSFDPNAHEALTHAPSKEHKDNTVINVFKKGYKYHDRTLRHSQVVVSKEVKD